MNKELEFETYLSISLNKFEIYLFDTINQTNLYKEEKILKNRTSSIDYNNLKIFLDDNIFKIEKLTGKFIKDIFLILENEKIFNLVIGIKKKNYNNFINQEYLQNSLIEAKDLFKENYQNEKIMHMIINKYLINDKKFSSIQNKLESDHLGLEIEFKSISINFIYDINKILENYHIKIIKYVDGNYVKTFFKYSNIDVSEMAHKILKGFNENEVMVVPKNIKKLAFFEKFFQLFS